MKAVVLAGGYATRLWPITKDRPKILLPVGDTTPLSRLLDDFEADTRIDTVYVSTNERFAEEFEQFVRDSRFEKPVVSVETTRSEDQKLGVVGALADLIDREGIDDDLIVVGGDNLFGFGLDDFVDFFETRNGPCVAVHDIGSRERARAYGVVETDGTHVESFQEKPAHPSSSLVSTACYALPATVLPSIRRYLSGQTNPDEPGRYVQWLNERRSIGAFRFDETWYDIGSPESYLEAVAWQSDGGCHIADDATVRNSDIGPAVHVMSGAEIVDSSLEHCVVFPSARVADCDLSWSIVDEHAEVAALAREDLLVGSHTQLTNDRGIADGGREL